MLVRWSTTVCTLPHPTGSSTAQIPSHRPSKMIRSHSKLGRAGTLMGVDEDAEPTERTSASQGVLQNAPQAVILIKAHTSTDECVWIRFSTYLIQINLRHGMKVSRDEQDSATTICICVGPKAYSAPFAAVKALKPSSSRLSHGGPGSSKAPLKRHCSAALLQEGVPSLRFWRLLH